MAISVHHGDCREIIPILGVTVDSVVCDPPYGLNFMGVAWDTMPAGRGKPVIVRQPDVKWDRDGGVAFDPETWRIVSSVMRPGAFLLAFGGTRTSHRMISAIEDAGFVIQDKILWMFATGFPKRRDMLKPAYEDICLAYKPGGKRTMSVDECRIGNDVVRTQAKGPQDSCFVNASGFRGIEASEHVGRWPANVVLENCDEVIAAFPETAISVGGVSSRGAKGALGWSSGDGNRGGLGDSGSAARFFMSAKAGPDDRWSTLRHEVTISWISETGLCQAVLLVATALSPQRVIAASGSITADEWNTFLFGSGLTEMCRKASKSTIKMTTSSPVPEFLLPLPKGGEE